MSNIIVPKGLKLVPEAALVMTGSLTTQIVKPAGRVWRNGHTGPVKLQGEKLLTNAFRVLIVTALRNAGTANLVTCKFHGFGTGVGEEAITQTGLTTEFAYTPASGGERPTGNQKVESLYIYLSEVSYAVDTNDGGTVTEHGVFYANTGATLIDRTLLGSPEGTDPGDIINAAYRLTIAAES